MADHSFENDVIDRLARLEEKLDNVIQDLICIQNDHVTRREFHFVRNGFIGSIIFLLTAVADYFIGFLPHP
jgi:hypothetical protein